jgi:hypothetical protein
MTRQAGGRLVIKAESLVMSDNVAKRAKLRRKCLKNKAKLPVGGLS